MSRIIECQKIAIEKIKTLSENKLLLLAEVMPYICLFAIAVTLILLFKIGRSDLAAKGLYLAVAVSLASLIAIWQARSLKESPTTFVPSISLSPRSFLNIILLFGTLYFVSLYLVIGTESRPLSYFVLIGVMAILIFIEILTMGREHTDRKNIILLQIAGLLANSIFSQTLKLPLYHGGDDILAHMYLINTIIENGHVTSDMAYYQYFPIFHIVGVITTELTAMELQTSYFIVTGLVFLAIVPIVYLLINQATQDIRLALLATLLYSMNREIIYGGMYFVTRTLATIFSLLLLYLLLRSGNDPRLKFIAIVLILPIVFTHQSTLVVTSMIFIALILIELVMYRRSRHIGYTYPILFTVAYLTYWLYIAFPFFSNIIVMIANTNQPIVIPSGAAILQESLFVCLLKSVDSAIMAFLAILGMLRLFYTSKKGSDLSTIFALFSLMAFSFCFKGPGDLLRHILLVYRVPLLFLPFITFAMANGVLFLAQQITMSRQRLKSMISAGICLFIIFLFFFSSVVILGNTTDFDNSKIVGTSIRYYFTESELKGFSFYNQYEIGAVVYTDHQSGQYIRSYLRKPATISDLRVFENISIEKWYMLLRREELELKGQILFTTGVLHGLGVGEAYFYKLGDSPDLRTMWEQHQKIYDNADVQIYSN